MSLLGSLLKRKSIRNSKRRAVSHQTVNRIINDWSNVEVLLQGKTPSQLRQALITADKALDNALRDVVTGDTMGERLKNAKDKFDYATYDKLWKAHKMRNALVHEAGYEPQYHMVKKAVANLKVGLNRLGVKL